MFRFKTKVFCLVVKNCIQFSFFCLNFVDFLYEPSPWWTPGWIHVVLSANTWSAKYELPEV